MKFTLSQPKPQPINKALLALGAGIAALATYAASSKIHREKIKSVAENLKDRWTKFLKSSQLEFEMDDDAAKKTIKKAARKVSRKLKS